MPGDEVDPTDDAGDATAPGGTGDRADGAPAAPDGAAHVVDDVAAGSDDGADHGLVGDPELAALEAAEARAREEARRAAKALKKARKARERADAALGAAAAIAATDARVDTEAPGAVAPTDVVVTDPSDPSGPDTSIDLAKSDTAARAARPVTAPGKSARKAASPGRAGTGKTVESKVTTSVIEPPVDASSGRRRPRRVTVVATALVVAAAVFAGIALAVLVGANNDESGSPAKARDAALLSARQDIVVLNTLDYTKVDVGLQNWLAATTGTLHDQLSQVSATDKQAITASKSVTTAKVLAAAVTQVDPNGGNATVIASVQVDVTPATGSPTSKRERFSATMKRDGTIWKLSVLQQVGVTLS